MLRSSLRKNQNIQKYSFRNRFRWITISFQGQFRLKLF